MVLATTAFGLVPGFSKIYRIVLNPVHYIFRPGIVTDAAAFAPFIMLDSFALHE